MTNEDLKEYFGKRVDELLNDTSHYERVFVNLGELSVCIEKVFNEFNKTKINYVYNNEIIRTSQPTEQDIISNLIELSYYPEKNLQELSLQSEINRKKKSLIEEIHGDINKVCKEFKPLRDKIDLYVKLYGEDYIEDQISLFVLKRDMDYIYRKLNGEND